MDRKEIIKKQREKLKRNPTQFIKDNVTGPTWNYWKERPFHALWTFCIWLMIMYMSIAVIQAVNNDMIYCNCTNSSYNGKIMENYNNYAKFYNEKALKMQNSINPINKAEQERLVKEFNENNNMFCTYDVKRWFKEPITLRMKTIWKGLVKIILKKS